MPLMPFNILGIWFRGLLAVAVLVGGLALLRKWYHDAHVMEPVQVGADGGRPGVGGDDRGRAEGGAAPARRVFHWNLGWNRETAELAGAVTLLTWALLGRPLYGLLSSVMLPKSGGSGSKLATGTNANPADDPHPDRGNEVRRIRRPDGSEIQVECYGPADAPAIVLTHGWGCDSTEWYYVKSRLAERFRLIVWDLPGLGLSKKPDNNDYRLEKLAEDLGAVINDAAGGRPVVLAGHSIGGMIALTFCRLFHGSLGTRVAGLVLVHTTHTNPVRTTKGAEIYTALEKPVLVPLLYLTIALWPLVWLMNWMSYLNGSAHRSTHKQSFAGTETKAQLDFTASYLPHARPDVLARGMLGMLAYDATATLATVNVPAAVIAGNLDTTTPPEASRFMVEKIPHARLVNLAPARHHGLLERHEEFDRALAGFVETCLKTGTVGGPVS